MFFPLRSPSSSSSFSCLFNSQWINSCKHRRCRDWEAERIMTQINNVSQANVDLTEFFFFLLLRFFDHYSGTVNLKRQNIIICEIESLAPKRLRLRLLCAASNLRSPPLQRWTRWGVYNYTFCYGNTAAEFMPHLLSVRSSSSVLPLTIPLPTESGHI